MSKCFVNLIGLLLAALHSLKVLFVLMSVWWKGALGLWLDWITIELLCSDGSNMTKQHFKEAAPQLDNLFDQQKVSIWYWNDLNINNKQNIPKRKIKISHNTFFNFGIWLVNRKLENYFANQGYNFSKLYYNFVFCEIVWLFCHLLVCPKSGLAILPIKWT